MNHCNAHLAQGYFLHHYIHVAINDGEEEQDVFFVIFNLFNAGLFEEDLWVVRVINV